MELAEFCKGSGHPRGSGCRRTLWNNGPRESSVDSDARVQRAEVVGEVLENLRRTFPHVVCVDDGSTDDSAQICRDAGAVVVQHPINLGQGAALQTGFEYALQDPEMDCVVTFDSDGQHRVVDAYDMVQRIRTGEADAAAL